MARILITGGRAPAALELCRQFGQYGHTVMVADSVPFMLCGGSSTVAKAFRVPEARGEPRRFADAIATIARQENIDLVVPTCEEVFYLGRFKADIERAARVFAPDIIVLHQLHNKWRFADFVRQTAGFGSEVRAPESWLVQRHADLPGIHPDQLVLKPVYSRFAVETLVRPAPAGIAKLTLSSERPWIAQRFIVGREFCCYAVAYQGRVTALSAYQPSWRAGKGAGIYFEPLTNPKIVAFVEGLARHFNLTGQVSFDFIEQPDGALFVLECNPRATSGAHLFRSLAPAFFGMPVSTDPAPRMVASAMLPFSLGRLRAGGLPALRQFVGDFMRAKDVIWRMSDPWPAFYALAGTSYFLWQAFRNGIDATAATTLDIAWDGGEIA